ncbi:MAG: glycosyltransferase family 1 protein [bacterium]|nr:glycosyltransferase family 1 protein [bacterium]
MKVGLDLSPIIYHRGVSRYTSNLFAALAEIEDLELFAYASAGRGQAVLKNDLKKLGRTLPATKQEQFWQNLCLQKIPPKLNFWLWHYLKTNHIKKCLPQIEVFHSWDYLQPPDTNLPLVSTIHDLAILKNPQIAHPEILRHHQQSWQILKQRNAHIIAVSQATKKDVIELLGFPEDHVHLVYEALPQEQMVALEKLTPNYIQSVKDKFNLTKPFFLFVGTREPRKNLQRLIEAWQPLKEQTQLVLVGSSGWDEPNANEKNLKVLPATDSQELAALYKAALALTFPSLDEGFGLPILEAFYYQTLVMTSKKIATSEVAGEAAFLIDPLNVEEMTATLKEILNLTATDKKIWQVKMQKQLAKFSWTKAAQETYQVYQQAYQDFYA